MKRLGSYTPLASPRFVPSMVSILSSELPLTLPAAAIPQVVQFIISEFQSVVLLCCRDPDLQ